MNEMSAYELMIKTNHYLIQGGILTDNQKAAIAERLMAARRMDAYVQNIRPRTASSDKRRAGKRRMGPGFFIPPCNDGKKIKTILGQTPKTQILSANMYELEILRLLALFCPDDPEVKFMVERTLNRLKTTCFGYQDDGLGECFDASLVVLRFLITAAPQETEWIQSRINNYKNHYSEKKRPRYCEKYFQLCMSELQKG